eukprot:1950636-Amphidinium_carterae.1
MSCYPLRVLQLVVEGLFAVAVNGKRHGLVVSDLVIDEAWSHSLEPANSKAVLSKSSQTERNNRPR